MAEPAPPAATAADQQPPAPATTASEPIVEQHLDVELTCNICLCSLVFEQDDAGRVKKTCVMVGCGHLFHENCLRKAWIGNGCTIDPNVDTPDSRPTYAACPTCPYCSQKSKTCLDTVRTYGYHPATNPCQPYVNCHLESAIHDDVYAHDPDFKLIITTTEGMEKVVNLARLAKKAGVDAEAFKKKMQYAVWTFKRGEAHPLRERIDKTVKLLEDMTEITQKIKEASAEKDLQKHLATVERASHALATNKDMLEALLKVNEQIREARQQNLAAISQAETRVKQAKSFEYIALELEKNKLAFELEQERESHVDCEAAMEEMRVKRQDMEEMREEVDTVKHAKEQLEGQVTQSETRIQDLEALVETLRKNKADLTEQKKEDAEQIRKLKKKLQKIEYSKKNGFSEDAAAYAWENDMLKRRIQVLQAPFLAMGALITPSKPTIGTKRKRSGNSAFEAISIEESLSSDEQRKLFYEEEQDLSDTSDEESKAIVKKERESSVKPPVKKRQRAERAGTEESKVLQIIKE